MGTSTGNRVRAPQLSVLVPAYNEAATIGDVLRSLGALTYELEIIVVDDG
jgi:glycosyltransferase involved in cell wall biosynthesis